MEIISKNGDLVEFDGDLRIFKGDLMGYLRSWNVHVDAMGIWKSYKMTEMI